MDEYIKREDAKGAVCFGCNQEFSDEPCEPDACAIRKSIMALPTSDVVPKSEVERWRKEAESQSILWRQHFESIYETAKETFRAEVAMEIFEEIEDVLNNIGYFDEIDFKALKKKYTEEIRKEDQ